MNFNLQDARTKQQRYGISPRLERLAPLLKIALIISAVIAIDLPIILTGYYSEVAMKSVATGGIVVMSIGLLFILAYPSHNRPARRVAQIAAEIIFTAVCINLTVLLVSLWGDFTYSDLALRYSAMLHAFILALIVAFSLLVQNNMPWLPPKFRWVIYTQAGCIMIALLMLIPVLYHYVGRSWMEIVFQSQPPLPRIYFNAVNLFFYTSVGCSLLLVYLKQVYQKKS